MDEPRVSWRLGRWIARRTRGTVILGSTSREISLDVAAGKIVAVRGIDPTEVGVELELAPIGHPDLLTEARALAARYGLAETTAVGAAKAVLQRRLQEWLEDPGHTVEVEDAPVEASEGPSISLTHALVELVLADESDRLPRNILPDLDVLLRRSPHFLELYAPLRLSEEADLIVAKITGQRTAVEIAARSPHGREEVIRLLAALVVTGMLEPVPVASSAENVDLIDRPAAHPDQATRRRLPVWWVLAAVVLLSLALALAGFALLRGGEPAPEVVTGGSWTLVVDMGCEPTELQRVLQKANQHPKELRAVRASLQADDPCWRLVWGRFSSESAAAAASGRVPQGFLRDGFTPHPLRLDDDGADGG